jgi:hypothetical protein
VLLCRLRATLDLDATAPESRPTASRFALLRRARSALDLGPVTPAPRLLPLLGPLVLAATLAPVLGQQAGVKTWMILSMQGLAIAGSLALIVAMVRVRSR